MRAIASGLPPPPVPADADLTHYDDMPLEVRRLRDSGIAGVVDAEVFRCAVLLWCAAWHQIPAGSLPKEDADLCRFVGLGRDLKTWTKIKAGVLRGWTEFADGRLYHRVVGEKVMAGWNGTRLNRWAKECDRIRKENKARQKRGEPELAAPSKPEPLPLRWPISESAPAETASASAGTPPENALNRMEGNGMDVQERAPAGLSLREQPSRLSATREGLGGPARDPMRALIERTANAVRMPA